MKKLLPFANNPPSSTEVWALLHHQGAQVEAQFLVKGLSAQHTSSNFSLQHDRNWGLWNFDVVECFLFPQKVAHLSQRTPYYEFQLSPLGQRFSLVIERPRLVTHSPYEVDFVGHNDTCPGAFGQEWRATLNLTLPEFQGSTLWGNLCACLGPPEAREYFALNWNQEGALDFHRPEAFVLLEKNRG